MADLPEQNLSTNPAPQLAEIVKSLSFRRCKVDLEFENIAYSVKVKKTRKTVLSGVSGRFKHGRLNCIMGPSGAGKSSFLNVLAGFNTITDGNIYINGEPHQAKKCMSIMSQISSYIMQDDHLLGELTAKETVTYAARFKLPQTLVGGKPGYEDISDKVLTLTGLTDSANCRVGQLSGGQRKRLAVAVELVNYPPLILLDECTTGLDSTSCYRLVRMLKMLAKNGCNIITTIHQPNSLVYRMFDWLYVMAPGGYIAYEGHPLAVTRAMERIGIPCLSSENPADVLFENSNIPHLAESWNSLKKDDSFLAPSVVDTKVPKQSTNKWDSCVEGDYYIWQFQVVADDKLEMKKLHRYEGKTLMKFCQAQSISVAEQWKIYLERSVRQTSRDKVFFYGRYLALFMVSLLMGYLFLNCGSDASKTWYNISLVYFMTNAMIAGPGLFAALGAEAEFKNLLRESVNGWYGVTASYTVRSMLDSFVNITCCAMFTTICWMMSGQPEPQVSMPIAFIVLSLQAVTTHHLMFILCLYGDTQSNLQFPFLLATVQMVFGGFVKPVSDMPVWISWLPNYLNYGAFAYKGLLKACYSPTPEIDPIIPCRTESMLCYRFSRGRNVLVGASIDIGSPWDEVWKIAAYTALFYLLGWPLLARRVYSAKREIARV